MTDNRRSQLVDWFFTHDNEWQNDNLQHSDYDIADDRFWEEIEQIYGSNIPKDDDDEL